MPSAEQKKCRRTTLRQVSFANDSKLHDGLLEHNQLFEQLIESFFMCRQEVSELSILALVKFDLPLCLTLRASFRDLIERMSQGMLIDNRESVPVLPRGGGSTLRLFKDHLPFVLKLGVIAEVVADRLATSCLKFNSELVESDQYASLANSQAEAVNVLSS